MNKATLIISILVTISSSLLKAQNPSWSLTPYYYDMFNFQNYPLPTTSTAQNASNMQLDANGEILFYVVDNAVRDKDGDLIGNLTSHFNNTTTQQGCYEGSLQSSEMMVVQDPGDCNRYYIISSGLYRSKCWNGNLRGIEPFSIVLDFNLQRPGNSQKNGALTTANRIQEFNSSSQGFVWYNGEEEGIHFAASTTRIDANGINYRNLFVTGRDALSSPWQRGIIKYRLDQNGITSETFIPFPLQDFSDWMRAELEIIDLPNGGFRIACPYAPTTVHNGKALSAVVYIFDLAASGNIIPNSENSLYFYRSDNNSFDNPYLSGLEFSPDGQILYISHNISEYHPHPLEYYDLNNFNSNDPNGNGIYSLDVGSINGVNDADFQHSQLEIATDGKLYLGADQRLASLSSPNNPTTSNFIDNTVLLPGYAMNTGMEIQAQFEVEVGIYALPDQIDGMDYTANAPVAYDEFSYTALASGTWSSGSNNPWSSNGDVFIEHELIIPSGIHVTIDNMTFRFAPDAKVIIEQGAKLTLDGGTFTNSTNCHNNEYWKGVEVWGTSNQHQSPQHHPTYQGMLEVINGGTIEYASEGATNWEPNNWDAIGGLILCTDATFKNNRRDIEFVKYQNYFPGNNTLLGQNFSRFENTNFISDDDFIETVPWTKVHVSLWAVQGIQFYNCHFTNSVSGDKSLSGAPNTGIHSLDAGYDVLPGCAAIGQTQTPCPTNQQLRSSFTGLENAVRASSSGSSETFTISRTDFTNNDYGIQVSATHNVSINRNNIQLGDGGYANSAAYGEGIYIENATGFIVEECTLTSTLAPSADDYGITIKNSGKLDNRVYKNHLFDQKVGTLAKGVNRSPGWMEGLQFLCNEYQDNDKAIFVDAASAMTEGIRDSQGEFNPTKTAGNTFTNNNLDISNLGNTFVYYHNFTAIETPSTIQGLVFLSGEEAPNNCPSSFITLKPLEDLITIKSDSLLIHRSSLDSVLTTLEYNLIALIDNGNTELLQQQVENNWSSDAWNLRNNLIQKSPYLSADALLTAAEQNILPNAMLLEVLLANPDATRGESFIADLILATNNSLPAYMLDFVRNSWNTETTRTNLEAQIAATRAEISSTTNYAKYLEKIKKDYTYNSRKASIEPGDDIMDEMEMMEFFIGNHEWTKADSVLLSIENNPDFTDLLAFVEDYDNYITFRAGLGTRTLAELDSTETAYLETLAAKDGRVTDFAQNILCYFYDDCANIGGNAGGNPKSLQQPATTNMDSPTLEELMYNVELYPNPANDFSSIKWEIFDELENCTYQVFDLSGKNITSGAIPENKGELTLDTRRLNNGTYIINIYNGGVLKSSSKLVVTKQ